MTYTPSLLIGLGGTGAQVLLRVKHQLKDSSLDNMGLYRFLFIDTDLSTFSSKKSLPEIKESEKCFVGANTNCPAKCGFSNADVRHPGRSEAEIRGPSNAGSGHNL